MNIRSGIFAFMATLCMSMHAEHQQALILESSGKGAHDYRNFRALAHSVGFETTFHDFYSCLNNVKFQKCQTIFLFIDNFVLKNTKHSLVKNYIKSIGDYVASGDKNLALFFQPTLPALAITEFLHLLGIELASDLKDPLTSFVSTTLRHDIHKGKLFGTTLINKTTKKLEKYKQQNITDQATGDLLAFTLPDTGITLSPEIEQTMPLAFCFQDHQAHNTYLIANSSDFSMSELAENFFANPLEFEVRQERLLAAQRTLQAWHTLVTEQSFTPPSQLPLLELPQKLTKKFNFARKQEYEKKMHSTLKESPDYEWLVNRPLLCAWLEPDDYFMPEPEGTTPTALERGMDFLYESGITLAWFEFNPELMLSTITQKDPEPFLKKVTTLSTALNKRFSDGKHSQPKFFVGTDITTNYRSNPVAIAAKDFFGTAYTKIPCPLDFDGFWKPELLDVFDSLIEKLAKEVVIDGIFLDFEMYHAQDQASGYSDFMDFSDLSWKLYATKTKNNNLLTLVSVDSRTQYLAEHNLFDSYFSVLTQEARRIGTLIRTHITQKLPHALLAVYATTLPSGWFYRGMMAGLSTPERPLIMATFNTDVYSHATWLTKQGIHLIHGTAVMLSKLEKAADTKIISDLLQYQYFTWLNRPSRMIYPQEKRKTEWWASEASSLPAQELARAIYQEVFGKNSNLF